ncbi:MAG: hypothetical protein RIM23_21550 [Coleofasciculus sp. G3-WIS-01]|uniref:hypothetical protein n=1 Tax=Coleofasciculus sp. G3-WIS-01 TaxID=3069528 RepID=UPI0032FC9BAE
MARLYIANRRAMALKLTPMMSMRPDVQMRYILRYCTILGLHRLLPKLILKPINFRWSKLIE